jgi:hypothetical protein
MIALESLKMRDTVPGWWYTYPSEKYDFVSWDDDIPNIWKLIKNVPNHQAEEYGCNNKMTKESAVPRLAVSILLGNVEKSS